MIDSLSEHFKEAQKSFCAEHDLECVHTTDDAILGFAVSTKALLPINGLRHPAVDNTSGWYIWCGEQFSDAQNFFEPTHARHIYEQYPQIAKLLGLPPGYRFLLAGEYLDFWFDSSLLNV